MKRMSSPSVFLSYLEIAKTISAGGAYENDVVELIEVLESEDPMFASKQKLIVANALLGVPRAANGDDKDFILHFVLFDIEITEPFPVVEFNEAAHSGVLMGCEISDETQRRLLLSIERPALQSFFRKTACDHFVSDVVDLFSHIPGMYSIDTQRWVWTANIHKDDATLVYSWIEISGLTEFVSLATAHPLLEDVR